MNDQLHQIDKQFTDLTCNITRNTLKVGAVLRLLQHRFDNSTHDEIHDDDMGALIDLCVETLPSAYKNIYDPLENLSDQYYRVAAHRNELLEKTLAASQIRFAAMAAIANPNTTADELAEAGTAIYQLAQAIQEHEADWKTWVGCVEARGYAIGLLDGPGDSKQVHLIAAKQGNLRTTPSLDSDLSIIGERLSAEDIEEVSNQVARVMNGFLRKNLRLKPEPIAPQDRQEVGNA